MKHAESRPRRSLTLRLTTAIAITLIAFTLLAGILYNVLMEEKTIDQYSHTLQRNAYAISQNLHDLLAPATRKEALDDTRLEVSWDMLAPYLALTEQITHSNVYLVDTAHTLTGYFDGVVQTLDNILLPAYLEQSIALGFMGKTPFIRSGSGSGMHLTACAPVMDEKSHVLGVVLLDTTLQELGYTQVSGTTMLAASTVIAFIVALLLAFVLSKVFARPIDQTRQAALALASGQYEVRLKASADDEVGQLASSMNILAERLEEARRHEADLKKRQQAFFSTISHELRTPVTVLRGSVESLADGIVKEPEAIQATYHQMLTETAWLQKLIADLLDLSRLRDPDFAIEMSNVDLAELLGDVAMSSGALCGRKGITFVCEEPRVNYSVLGDYQRLRQMLMAVVDNAVKFTDANKKITLSLSETQPVITVEDEGMGIAPEEIDHIFERFYHTRTSNTEGTGLGLALVREIAIRHNIDVTVSSIPGKGTTFSFIFVVNPSR